MMKTLAALIAFGAICTAAYAGPTTKSKAAKDACGSCPSAAAAKKTNAQCPSAKADCATCPSAKATAKSDCATCPSGSAGACPVSGGKLTSVKCGEGSKKIDVAKLTAEGKYADYKGKRYFWACDHCAKDFKANPAGYASRHTGFMVKTAKVSSKAAN
jgi:YHS domain-containing protein